MSDDIFNGARTGANDNESGSSNSGNNNNNNNNNSDNEEKVNSIANIIKKMMPESLNGKSYSNASQNNTYIVIHNTAGGTAKSNAEYFHRGADGRKVCTHYVIDDKEIYQLLENNWKGHHCGDAKDDSHKATPMGNNNTIGIEVADGNNVDHNKSIEVCIELTRHIMKQTGISVNNVIRHHDVTGKTCPATIMSMKVNGQSAWEYIKSEIKSRNEANKPIQLDSSLLSGAGSSGSGSGGSGSGGTGTGMDILPNVDHRYNIANMDEIKGACLIFLPPYNVCTIEEKEVHFKTWNDWDRDYHYIIDPTYDVDANPDDDIPDLSNAKGLDEMNNADENGTKPEPSPGENYEEASPANIIPRAPIDDNGSSDTTQSGDGGGAKLTEAEFNMATFAGDSLTVGLGNSVKNITTYAASGHTVGQGRAAHAKSIIKKGSKIVVLSYGTNDSAYTDPSGFMINFKNLINDIKAGIPGVYIFVNKIFPGDPNKVTSASYKKAIQNIPSHNEALEILCRDTGAILLDCTNIPKLTSYYTDGIHFTGAFYKLWYEEMKTQILSYTGENTSYNAVISPSAEEDNSIIIKGGFQHSKSRLLQCYGLEDNNKVTYISRSLYNSKPTAHCIMIACFIPTFEQLTRLNTTYVKVEKNIINAVSKILWANGLKADDLWREFDMNRTPSPAQYLDRNRWTDLLLEIDKQIVWRNKKFGKVTTKYEKYVATIPDQTIPDVGISNSGGPSGTTGTPGTMDSGNEVANTCYSTFTGLGLCPEAACGVLGNIYQESGMNPKAVNSSSGATGLCQWLGGRLTGLKNYASSKGTEWTDVKTQCEWAWMECEGKDDTTKKLLDKNCGGPEGFKKLGLEKAVDMWRRCFERCGEHEANDARRLSKAKEYYSKIVSNGGTSTASIQPRDNQNNSNSSDSSGSSSGTSRLSWPVPGHDVGSGSGAKFGMRLHPIYKVNKMHNGIDIPAPGGTPIKAAAAGEVTLNKFSSSAGNYIKIKHAQGLETVYMHMQALSPCAVGSSVSAGQEIGKVGTTGSSTGNHLHFEVHDGGSPKDPLQYTNINNSSSTITGDTGGGSGSSGGTTSTGDWIYNGPIINSIWGDIENPGPAAELPYNGNSMGGLEHDDWGGKTSYYVDAPTDENAEKPTIDIVFTNTEYRLFCERYFTDEIFKEDGTIETITNFNKFWQLMDLLKEEHEPYDKGLVAASDATITPNDRLGALTTTFTTDNENVFHFNVLESGPGSNYHCVKAADELNYIVTPKDLRVEPIYPDLIIPPQFTTSDYDSNSENSIPLSQLTEVEGTEFLTKQLSFDYDILKDIKKETNKCLGPVNFLDPYPTDDKIEELEQHYPKVFIDEIESQIYSCNHPGCPIGQPMAKNFAMLSDAIMDQSQRTEKRLVRLENVLSTIMRNQARLSSRININCVYYGGQSTYAGKYKCIRCMHDDRINDGAIVTLDQCLNCTRYEPIIGQVYQILDETGFNGSILLDDMQMSYSNLETFKKQNIQSEQSPKYGYISVNDDTKTKKPEKDLIELWKEANKEAYIKTLPEQIDIEAGLTQKDEMVNSGIATTDEPIKGRTIAAAPDGGNTNSTDEGATDAEQTEVVAQEIPESHYIFRMNWNESFLNSQRPDTKQYPTEGIIMRFKKQEGDYSYNEELKELDPEKDKDTIEDIQKQIKLVNGIWVDTREKSNTVQVNKYSSEKFYFDGFAEMKASTGPSNSNNSNSGVVGSGSECRKKILEMAETIVKECSDGKAWYSQNNRTVDYNKPGYNNGKKAYDCTGFVSCCYLNAGLKSMYAKTCGGGTLMDEILNNQGQMWLLNEEGLSKALPGDVLVTSSRSVSQSDMDSRNKVPLDHAMIYMGDNTIAHAANSRKGIVKETIESWRQGKTFFVRPKDLIDADAASSSNSDSSQGVEEEKGEVEGQAYVARVSGAVVSSYTGTISGTTTFSRRNTELDEEKTLGCELNKTCASHNLPYGTKIYIPQLKEKLGGNGVFTVTDTCAPYFDFDIYTTANIDMAGYDVYILEWGTGEISQSFTSAINDRLKFDQWYKYKSVWNKYKTLGGKLYKFTKFNQEDYNIKNHPNFRDK